MRNGSQATASICGQLHQKISQLPQRWGISELDEPQLPRAGIYFIYEQGEILSAEAVKTHGVGNRIVRVGTHKAGRNLRTRLRSDHLGGNREGSIQRKYIGVSLMKRDDCSSNAIEHWKRKRKDNPDFKNPTNNKYEKMVSGYIATKMPYRCLNVPNEPLRLSLEKKII